MYQRKAVILLIGLFSFCVSAAQDGRFNPDSLQIKWKLRQNQKADSGFRCVLTFTNHDQENLIPSGWKIYFNLRYHGRQLKSIGAGFRIKHVSGELFYIEPDSSFAGLQKGQSVSMEFTGKARIANYQDIPSGLFWVYDSNPQSAMPLKKILIGKSENGLKGEEEELPETDITAMFNENNKITDIPVANLPKIFPSPLEYQELSGSFLLNKSLSILDNNKFQKEAGYLADEIQKLTGTRPAITDVKKPKQIILQYDEHFMPEAYRMEINPDEIKISAGDGAGIFYGIQSLKSILPADVWATTHSSITVPAMKVADAPRFPIREFMLDVARNFQSMKEILKILDLMSLYKLNVFHFHLTDDEGWRLAIPGLPELTDVGANRGYPFGDNHQLHPSYGSGPDGKMTSGSGYYSREEFIEILKYATLRHIFVIPEIESPGHARAAVKAMNARYDKYVRSGDTVEAGKYLLGDPLDQSVYMSNQYFNDNVMNVAIPSTYRFMEKVIQEISHMYREAGAPLQMIHTGADEVPQGTWKGSPAAIERMREKGVAGNTKELWREYFEKIKNILMDKGISMTGWEELAIGTQDSNETRNVIMNTGFIKDKVLLEAWWNLFGNEDVGYKLANSGYNVILSFVDYFYFDLAYNKSFNEPGDGWVGYIDLQKVFSFIPYNYYKNNTKDIMGGLLPENYFASKELLTEPGKSNILGLQAALWGENLNSPGITGIYVAAQIIGNG